MKIYSDESNDWESRYPESIKEYMTPEGHSSASMFNKYGLFEYYDPMAGNALIPVEDFEGVKRQVFNLIRENEGWVLGYGQKASGYEEDFWYVTDWIE